MGWKANTLPARSKWTPCHPKKWVHLHGLQLLERMSAGGIRTPTQVLRLWKPTSWSKKVPSNAGLKSHLHPIITWSGPGFYMEDDSLKNTQTSSILFDMAFMLGYPPSNKHLPPRTVHPLPFTSTNSTELSPMNVSEADILALSLKPKLRSSLDLLSSYVWSTNTR